MEVIKRPKVSVIIPTIGRESLPEAIESILKQTFQDFEIIITDDTEDEKTRSLVERYLKDPRIRYVVNRKYMHGPAGNKNNGLDHITGEYFIFLDDDDILFKTALEDLLTVAEKGNYGFVLANCIDDINGELTGKHYGKDQEVYWPDFLCGKFEGEYFVLVHTSLLGSDRFIEECWGGESILWWRLWKKAKRGFYLHKALRVYRLSPEDRGSKKMLDTDKVFRSFLNYKYTLEIYKEDFKNFCPQAYLRWAIRCVYFASLSGKKSEILKILKDSFVVSARHTLIFLMPWTFFCLIFPKSALKFLYEKIFKSVGLSKWIKNILLKS